MRGKKLLAMTLCTVMTAGLLAGCGGGKGNTSAAVDLSSAELTGEENEWGWIVPEETLVLDVYGGEGDQEKLLKDEYGGKAKLDGWLKDNLNVQINWQYYSTAMDEKLNLMLANGDYPAIITNMTDEMADKFIAQGKALDLTEAIEKFGDNIQRRYGQYLNMLRSEDGKIYKLANLYGYNPNVAGYDFGIRYDYWEELGEPEMYSTPEGYYEALKKVLENHPTNANGQTTYGASSTDKGQNFLKAMLAAYGFINEYKHDEASGTFTHWLNTEEGLEIAQFVNKMYRDGLIDPDFLSTDYETLMTKMQSEQILGNFGTWWYGWTGGHQYWATQDPDNYTVEKRFANVSVHADGVAMEDTTLLTANFLGSYRCIITDKCKDLGMVMRYLNWENSEMGNFIMGWGAPDEDNVWKIDEDGTWLMDDDILSVDTKETTFHKVREDYNGGGSYMIALNGQWLRTDETQNFDHIDPRVDRVSVYDYWPVNEDGTFSDEGIRLSWGHYNAQAKDISMYNVTYDPNAEITITKQTIKDMLETEWARMITAGSEEECEQIFMEAREKCNGLGLEELTEYVKSQYEANVTKFEGK
ncbi:hypothetical protein [Eisenbergiella sp.]